MSQQNHEIFLVCFKLADFCKFSVSLYYPSKCFCYEQIIGTAVLAVGIWILVDKPENFFKILDEAGTGVCGDDPNCDEFSSNVYNLGAYALIGLSAVMVIIAFFGCCGAIKENKCMLGTYFSIIVVLFILMLVGAVMGYFFQFEKRIKIPLDHALMKYRDNVNTTDNATIVDRSVVHFAIDAVAVDHPDAYKNTWNKIQEEVSKMTFINPID